MDQLLINNFLYNLLWWTLAILIIGWLVRLAVACESEWKKDPENRTTKGIQGVWDFLKWKALVGVVLIGTFVFVNTTMLAYTPKTEAGPRVSSNEPNRPQYEERNITNTTALKPWEEKVAENREKNEAAKTEFDKLPDAKE